MRTDNLHVNLKKFMKFVFGFTCTMHDAGSVFDENVLLERLLITLSSLMLLSLCRRSRFFYCIARVVRLTQCDLKWPVLLLID